MIDFIGDLVNFYLIPGLVLGSIYALGAIGLTMTFGILRFANFAHGETMTLGAYFAWTLVQLTGWHPIAVLPIAMGLTVLVVLGIDRGFYKPFRASPTITTPPPGGKPAERASTSVAGLVGGALTLALALLTGMALKRRKTPL